MGIFSAMNVGCDGLKVHGARLDISSKNIAVFGTGNLPYVSGSVSMAGVVEDPTLGDKIYKPGHPDADENGYIRTSNVDPLVEITDAIMAQRAYEASLAILTLTKSMADKATAIGS